MENNSDDYEPGNDQNQGVVGTMARNQQHGYAEEEGTQKPDLDPNLVTNRTENTVENEEGDASADKIDGQEQGAEEGLE